MQRTGPCVGKGWWKAWCPRRKARCSPTARDQKEEEEEEETEKRAQGRYSLEILLRFEESLKKGDLAPGPCGGLGRRILRRGC